MANGWVHLEALSIASHIYQANTTLTGCESFHYIHNTIVVKAAITLAKRMIDGWPAAGSCGDGWRNL